MLTFYRQCYYRHSSFQLLVSAQDFDEVERKKKDIRS